MSVVTEAVERVVESGEDIYIPCESVKQQESVRVMAYHFKKRRLGPEEELIGIDKKEVAGRYFVRLYKKKLTGLMRIDPATGMLVPVANEVHPELARIISLMQKDGKTEEEIQEVKRDWETANCMTATEVVQQVQTSRLKPESQLILTAMLRERKSGDEIVEALVEENEDDVLEEIALERERIERSQK